MPRQLALALLVSIVAALAPADDLVGDRGVYQPTFFAEFQDVEVDGSRAYVFGVGGLAIFDASDPDAPLFLGRYAPPDDRANRFYRGSIGDGVAYGGAREAGLDVVRVQQPTSPTLLMTLAADGVSYEGSTVADGMLYVCRHDAGLEILDLSDPEAPVGVAELTTLTNSWDVVVRDGLAYVADGIGGLAIVDVSEPSAPTLVSSLAIPNTAVSDVQLAGDVAVLAAGSTGLVTVDVSTPLDPTPLAVYDTSAMAATVAVDGDLAFVADWDDVEVVDISAPGTPVAAGLENTPGRAMGLDAIDGRIYVADWARLRIFDHGPTTRGDIEVPRWFEFGPTPPGTATDTVFTITNTGGGPLTVHDIEVFDDVFEFTPPLSFTVDAGESRDVPMRYTNPGFGVDLTFMQVHSDDTDESVVSLPVVGEPDPDELDVGEPAPPFTLVDLDGVTHELSQYLGRVVVLAFFANW